MAPIKLLFAAALLSVCFSSCSQTTAPGHLPVAGVFIATTPCNDVSKKLLHLPLDIKYAMMKWRLELNQDPGTLNPTTYKLVVKYGMDKQGSRDFAEGAQTIEWKGKWMREKTVTDNADAIVYKLSDETGAASLSFLQVGANLLHLLDEDRHPVVGTAAWSYTLNRIDPVHSDPSIPITIGAVENTSLPLSTDSLIVGVFYGRTPCNNDLLALNGISSNGCQIIKCQLTLYQDIKTHEPTIFQLYTIYVGKGDNKYSSTGKWIMTKGTQDDPNAIVYQLQPDPGKPQSLSFMKAGDNILFMLDENRNLLVGNEYVSFTLNKSKK